MVPGHRAWQGINRGRTGGQWELHAGHLELSRLSSLLVILRMRGVLAQKKGQPHFHGERERLSSSTLKSHYVHFAVDIDKEDNSCML